MQIFAAILSILGPIFQYVLKRWLGKVEREDSEEQIEDSRKRAVAEFKEQCMRAVKKIDLEFVLPLKEKGEFSADKAELAKSLAIKAVKDHYGSEKMVDLAVLFSVDAEGLMKLIGETIEAAILLNKGAIGLKPKVDIPDFLK